MGGEKDPVLNLDPNKISIPAVAREGRFDGEVITVVIHRLGVIDVRWNEKLGKWAWLRVLKSFLSSKLV